MPRSRFNHHSTTHVLRMLRDYESRNITFIEADRSWPIVWARAKGLRVQDADGKSYLDLTAAFGVAAAGHANVAVVNAGRRQMGQLLHAMGDVHPHSLKAQLAQELSRITYERWTAKTSPAPNQPRLKGKTIFCNSGFEAVEAALKTAMLATGKPGVLAFTGAYHGLGYGALNTTHRDHFRSPFRRQLRDFATFIPFPKEDATTAALAQVGTKMKTAFHSGRIGAVLVEPIQVRGGINIPPASFLPLLAKLSRQHGALLILDEIYTGFGRTGAWFDYEHSGVVPDVICLGKALTGGFPLSACVGRADVMDAAWPPSSGEAIHTSTFLGHPVGCAMALAQISELKRKNLVRASAQRGKLLLSLLKDLAADINTASPQTVQLTARGRGLLVGVELRYPDGKPATDLSLKAVKEMLYRGFILLPEGEHSQVISFSPPLTITERELRKTVATLGQVFKDII